MIKSEFDNYTTDGISRIKVSLLLILPAFPPVKSWRSDAPFPNGLSVLRVVTVCIEP